MKFVVDTCYASVIYLCEIYSLDSLTLISIQLTSDTDREISRKKNVANIV